MDIIVRQKLSGNYSGEFIKVALPKMDKVLKLDKFLSVLNIDKLESDKIKIAFIKDGHEGFAALYENPEVAEVYVLSFRNVDDVLDFKVKGTINNAKISLLVNFQENYAHIKCDYNKHFKFKTAERILEKIISVPDEI